jgi:hypothetical protein
MSLSMYLPLHACHEVASPKEVSDGWSRASK